MRGKRRRSSGRNNSVREGRACGGTPWKKGKSLKPMENAYCSRFSSWIHAGKEEKKLGEKVADMKCMDRL